MLAQLMLSPSRAGAEETRPFTCYRVRKNIYCRFSDKLFRIERRKTTTFQSPFSVCSVDVCSTVSVDSAVGSRTCMYWGKKKAGPLSVSEENNFKLINGCFHPTFSFVADCGKKEEEELREESRRGRKTKRIMQTCA
jgi:hypothetical protein